MVAGRVPYRLAISMRPIILWVLLASAAGAGGVVLGNNANLLLPLIASILAILEWAALRRLAGAFTPAAVPVLVINAIGVLGFLFFAGLADTASVSAQLPTTDTTYTTALKIILLFTLALTLGAIVGLASASRNLHSLHGSRFTANPAVLYFTGSLPLLVLVWGKGSALIEAPYYLDSSGPTSAVLAGMALAPVGILAFAVSLFRADSRRIIGVMGLTGWSMVLFSIGTRHLALVPGLILLGRLLAVSDQSRRVGVFKVAAVISATTVLLQLPLVLRGTFGGVGLRPFTKRLIADPIILFDFAPQSVAGNVLFGVPLTGFVAESADLDRSDFWTSISPMPSFLTDWPVLSNRLRVNNYTPYSGLGELGAHGWLALLSYAALVGFALAIVHRIISGLPDRVRPTALVLSIALTVLFSIDMLQYNLRSATRLMWYLLVCLVCLRVLLGAKAGGTSNIPRAQTPEGTIAEARRFQRSSRHWRYRALGLVDCVTIRRPADEKRLAAATSQIHYVPWTEGSQY